MQTSYLHIDSENTYGVKIRLGGPHIKIQSSNQIYRLDENVVLAIRFEDIFIFPENFNLETSNVDWTGLVQCYGIIQECFLTGKEVMYIIELDNGDLIKIRKSETQQIDFQELQYFCDF